MKIVANPNEEQWLEITTRPIDDVASTQATVMEILKDVHANGEKALMDYALKFEGVALNSIMASQSDLENSHKSLSEELKEAITVAKDNIEKFHIAQLKEEEKIETTKGVTCWRKNVAIDAVGLYVPGGSAPLFSTVLMLGVPAVLAGCRRIIICTPADKEGSVPDAILYAAKLIGIKEIYKVGGAQAVAAMTYGNTSVPQVNKIFGPGNQFVTMAKQMVTQMGMAIDMLAGPSEVLVVADESSNAEFIASDLLAQAEHGPDSQVILVTDVESKLKEVEAALKTQLDELPRKEIASKAMENSWGVLLNNKEEMVAMVNSYAPEHLILAVEDESFYIDNVVNAGSVFVGNYTPESAGDYASGTNHTLPTNGNARAFSGVSIDSFIKKITYQKMTKDGIKNLGPVIETMAEAEELIGHKNAVSVRLKTL